jgi:hypothetical protein
MSSIPEGGSAQSRQASNSGNAAALPATTEARKSSMKVLPSNDSSGGATCLTGNVAGGAPGGRR